MKPPLIGALLTILSLIGPSIAFCTRRPLTSFRNGRYATTTMFVAASSVEVEKDRTKDAIGAWIPIGSANALQGLGPQRIRVMGLDFVVWENEDSTSSRPSVWSVMADACPHRFAPLSQGRVDPETNCLECPYHGWQFDTNGTLTKLPQLDPGKSIESIKNRDATQFPVHQAGDLIFAFLPSSIHGEMFPQYMLPEDLYPTLVEEMERTKATYFVRDLPYSADFVTENFMDPAHIPFAHHSLQGTRTDAKPLPMNVLTSNFTHVECNFMDQSRGKVRDGIVSWQRPSVYHFRTRPTNSSTYKTDLNIYIVPVEAGKSRVMYSLRFTIPWLPTWLWHAASNRFLNTDAWLHDAERVARSRSTQQTLPYVYGSQSDLGVRAFRQWWSKNGFSTSPPNTFGPASPEALVLLSRSEQIDPWENHSKHCSTCRKALKVIKRVQAGSLFCSLASVIVLRNWPLSAAAMMATGLYINHLSTKAATVIEGNPYPSGIADRSAAHSAEQKQTTRGQRIRLKFMRRK